MWRQYLSTRLLLVVSVGILLSVLAFGAWQGIVWPISITITTSTTTTVTSTTISTTTQTATSTTTSTTTSAVPKPVPEELLPIYGSERAEQNYEEWLKIWRMAYKENDGSLVPELTDDQLPSLFKGVTSKTVISSGGVASGVVTEGIGYALLIEGARAVAGDTDATTNGIALLKGWLGMVYGPKEREDPLGGGSGNKSSATDVLEWPYGISAIEPAKSGLGPSGTATWKYPLDLCKGGCTGAAADGDQDAVMGMIYLSAALGHPADLVDMTMRAVISFASSDLGFPDLYRTLPDGTKVFVPKCGSMWGGLTPSEGRWKTAQAPFCYSPGYFAPGHYRLFRDFVVAHWNSVFDSYLPPHVDASASTPSELAAAFDGAVIAGYNIMYRSSCESGTVSNWVGVRAACNDSTSLFCPGVPWEHTPYVGAGKEICNASGTKWGSWGPDASRTMWRIAMDYILYTDEAINVPMYDRSGHRDENLNFNAKTYLNRIARQYKTYSQCDAREDNCITASGSPYKMMFGWVKGETETDAIYAQRQLTCPNVPNKPETWWSHFMSYPSFAALIVPYENMTRSESAAWIHSYARICNFTGNNTVEGAICATTYFEVSQELIATMVMAGKFLKPKPLPAQSFAELGNESSESNQTAAPSKDNATETSNTSVLEVSEDNVTADHADTPAKPDVPTSRPSVMISSVLTALAAAAFALATGDVLLRFLRPSTHTEQGGSLITEALEGTRMPLTGESSAREVEANHRIETAGP